MRDIYYTCITTLANVPLPLLLSTCLWTCLTLPVMPQTKEHKVNNLEAADERATNANAQHAAHARCVGENETNTHT